MKKIFLGFVTLMMSAMLFAERVSLEDAAIVANHFMNVESSVNGAKKAPAKRMVRKATAEDAQYYIYENANGEGWVIISADDVVTPILAYSKTGHFRTDNIPANISKWMGKYTKFIKKVETDGVVASEETQAQWRRLRKGLPDDPAGNIVVGPLVQTQWDQDAPYNNLCPGSGSDKAYTGCVATAMAQVMNYWQWPKQGTGSHTYQPVMDIYDDYGEYQETIIVYEGELTANFGETTYDWDNMLNKYTSSATAAQKSAVATLMYHCGIATEMMYGGDEYDGSGTYTVNYGSWEENDNAQNALYHFFGYKQATSYMRDGHVYQGTTYYNSWTDAAWTAMVKEELDKQHPIMYDGAGNAGGHSFICDGYDDQNYFHFNWGWSGQNDGWYKLDNLVPGSGGAGGGSYSFSEDQGVIIGIVPTNIAAVAVTGVTMAPTTATIKIKGKQQLTAIVAPSNADNKKVTWTTSNSSIATVSETGLVKGIAAGNAIITVTTKDGGFTASCTITVTNEEEEFTDCDAYSYTFSAKMETSAKLGTYNWTLTGNSGGYYGYDETKGAQWGSGNNPAGSVSLTTANVADCLLSNIVVNASMGSKGDGKIAVYIGGEQVGSTQSLTSSAADYTFTNTAELQGNLEIRLTNSSKAMYIKSIKTNTGGSTPSSDIIQVNCQEAASATYALSDNATSTQKYAVTGYITSVYETISNNQQSFWMDDAQGSKKTFEAFWANLPEGISEFEVGMKVRVTGYLLHYVKGSSDIPEIKNGNVEILSNTTPIDNVQTTDNAIKVIENGQIVIIRGNEKYTIFGQKIQ